MKRFLSILLCVILVIASLESNSASALTESDYTESTLNRTRISECKELRSANSTTYLLADGSYECVVSSSKEYYFDASTSSYEKVDNTIIPIEKKDASGVFYGNKANDIRYLFSSDTPTIHISDDKTGFSFSLADASPCTPTVGSIPIKHDLFDMQSAKDAITYSNALEKTDIMYVSQADALKEYIILYDATCPDQFSYLFDSSEYSLKDSSDGIIYVVDKLGNCKYQLGNLFAVDSTNIYTDAVKYDITDISDTQTKVSIYIDRAFLDAEDRSYPVVIDPSIMITGESKTYDSYVSSRYPGTNYYLNNYLRTGKDDDYYVRRSYIKFDIPSSVTKNIGYASIRMKKYSGAAPNAYAYRVSSNWTSSSINWNNKPSYVTSDASPVATLGSNNWYNFDVTKIVTSWKNKGLSNYGFLIKDSNESNTSQWTTFYSSDAPSPNKPELHIYYVSYDTTLMALSEGSVVRDSYFNPVSTTVKNYRNNGAVYKQTYTSISHDSMLTRLQSTVLYFVHTHGYQNGVYLGNSQYFTTSSMSGKDLKNLRCALLLTCETGVGGYSSSRVASNTPINIVERLVICGARTVIGFDVITYVADCNKFAERFANRTMQNGYTIYNAIVNMNCSDFISDMSSHAVIGGETGQYLNW